MLNPSEIVYFWSSIMQDHADFFLSSLSYKETEFIKQAEYYKEEFGKLEKDANKEVIDNNIDNITNLLIHFVDFKKKAIERLLLCNIELNLAPTLINHMINEAMEFYRDLQKIKDSNGLEPLTENILLHTIWLPDAAGHAAVISDNLDPVETIYNNQATTFKKRFDELFIKSLELGKMLERTGFRNSSLEHFNFQVEELINEFIIFLNKIKNLRKQCKIIGNLDPLMVDHMIREEHYYLINIRSLREQRYRKKEA